MHANSYASNSMPWNPLYLQSSWAIVKNRKAWSKTPAPPRPAQSRATSYFVSRFIQPSTRPDSPIGEDGTTCGIHEEMTRRKTYAARPRLSSFTRRHQHEQLEPIQSPDALDRSAGTRSRDGGSGRSRSRSEKKRPPPMASCESAV